MDSHGEYVGQIHPPFSDRTSAMTAAPFLVRAKKFGFMVFATAVVFLLFWGASALFEVRWLLWTGYAVAGLAMLAGGYEAITARLAPCPYCNKPIGTIADITLLASDENKRFECDQCHELLISNKGELRAFRETDAEDFQKYDAPVFTGGVWPTECIVCGCPATRTKAANKTKVELSQLLIGRLSVAHASVSNIPYCDQHSGAVSLTKTDDHLRLVFTDMAMRRRYLAANAGNLFIK